MGSLGKYSSKESLFSLGPGYLLTKFTLVCILPFFLQTSLEEMK